MKNILLTESQFKNLIRTSLLSEGISDVTYHYCSLDSLNNILKSGKLGLSMSSNDADAYHNSKCFYLSTQRSKNPLLGYAGNSSKQGNRAIARIELNGDLLKQNGYQGMPIDYWGKDLGKQSDIGLNSMRAKDQLMGYDMNNLSNDVKSQILKNQSRSSNFEFEDRLFSNKPYLDLKYIKRIDCLIPGGELEPIEKSILDKAETLGINVSFYGGVKDFVLQDNKTMNNSILSSGMEYSDEDKDNSRTSNFRNKEIIAGLCGALMKDSKMDENSLNELQSILNKFGLGKYFEYCKNNLYKNTSNLDDNLHSLEDGLRKLNTDSLYRTNSSENIMLFAQYVMNHFGTNSINGLEKAINNRNVQDNTEKVERKEAINTIKIKENGCSTQILNPDTTTFWDIVPKDIFYDEVSRYVDEDEWNSEDNPDYNKTIKHNSKTSESFKKYLQHLMHNDNLSISDGANILNKITNQDQGLINSMFAFTIVPFTLTKDNFRENERFIPWTEQSKMRNQLFGSSEEYFNYINDNV